jgi:glycosyltransferase involved in cell wall biosynthesis
MHDLPWRKMKIAQVSPLYESVPPKLYGGTERVVSYLCEELVRLGHDVTLFASGDSVTAAELVPACPAALRLSSQNVDPIARHFLMLEQVYRRAADFDVIHFHVDYLHYPLTRRERPVHVTTLHGRLDLPDLAPLYAEYAEMPVISISNSQRASLPRANWQATVYHGLPLDLLRLNERPEGYLAFLGRISPEKRADWAIEIARRAGMELRIAAKIDPADQRYFESQIEPLFRQPHVTYIGEIGQDRTGEFLGNAAALLFPIDWPEPFGLVQIEAMACGTPVIALRRGSVPEVIDDGKSGFVCDGIDQAVEAVGRLPELSRRRCREIFERRFGVTQMASNYVQIYQRLIQQRRNCHERDYSGRGPSLHPGHLAAGGRAVEGAQAR